MNDNTKKIFEMLGVEPNERFKIEDVDNANYYIDENLIVWFETQAYRAKSCYGLSNLLTGDIKIIKLPKKKKLKDLTPEEFDKWKKKNCGNCLECIFAHIFCGIDNCWIYHKDLYSDKFLDQEVEIED